MRCTKIQGEHPCRIQCPKHNMMSLVHGVHLELSKVFTASIVVLENSEELIEDDKLHNLSAISFYI